MNRLDESRFNDDVTIVGGSPVRGTASSSADMERTMNDDRTMADSPVAPRRNPADQFDGPILAEIDQFALIKKLGEGAAGKVYMAYDRETKLRLPSRGCRSACPR